MQRTKKKKTPRKQETSEAESHPTRRDFRHGLSVNLTKPMLFDYVRVSLLANESDDVVSFPDSLVFDSRLARGKLFKYFQNVPFYY